MAQSKKIAIFVPNPCSPDYRVIKHAHLLKQQGHDVRIYCRAAAHVPDLEKWDGILYIRKWMSFVSSLKNISKFFLTKIGFSHSSKNITKEELAEAIKKYDL